MSERRNKAAQKKGLPVGECPLKIAMIGHKRIPSREGGVELVVEELAKRMVADGHVVHAYNRSGTHIAGKEYDTGRRKEFEGIRLITIPTINNAKLNAIVYAFFASIRVLFGGYDIVHYHAEGCCAMLWLPRLFGIKTVVTIHGLDWQRSKWGGFATRFLKFGEKVAAKRANEIIVLSAQNQKYFLDTYRRKTNFIPNGVDTPKATENTDFLAKVQIGERKYLLFLARIVPEKGLHYLIEAFKRVKTDFKLVIAGASSHTDEYAATIKASISGDGRIVTTGFVQGEELSQLFQHAYMYVLPSDIEGMPLSLLEAMSYGNCCLVSDIPENLAVVCDKALSFKHGDVDDLAEKLSWALVHPQEVDRYRASAALHVLERYNWDDVTSETLELYSSEVKMQKT